MTGFVSYVDSIDINWPLVLDFIIAAAIVTTARAAWVGLRSWKEEVRVRTDIDLRRRLIRAFTKVRYAESMAQDTGHDIASSYLATNASKKESFYRQVLKPDLDIVAKDLQHGLLTFVALKNEVKLADISPEDDNKNITSWLHKQFNLINKLVQLEKEIRKDLTLRPNQKPRFSQQMEFHEDEAATDDYRIFRLWLDDVFSHLPRNEKRKKT